ncbi:MAG: hypothetical protein F9K40_03650 [Kofleriaceae bacterium]|nr:MAG: hypothetical protein F9K40_03650 [Kofleriaceae bacterium]MBZ0233517.1 hypothetical protein [Kofleriaceae bacterium]
MDREPDTLITHRATRIGLLVGVPLAIVLGVPAASRAAAILRSWTSGETLTANDLNANFTALNTELARLDPLVVDGEGAVGIGTTTPQGKLHVNGFGRVISSAWNVRSVAEFHGPAASNSAVLFGTGATAGTQSVRGLFIGSASQTFGVARFDAAGTAAPTIDLHVGANGRVGVGTDAPAERLHVAGRIVADPTHAAAATNTQFATTSTTFVDVPGLAVTVTTHGKPVMLTVNTNYNPTTGNLGPYNSWGLLTITRNGTNLGHALYGMQIASSAINDNLPVSFTFVDTPPAGTHTYRLAARAGEMNVGILLGEGGVTQQLTATQLN